MIRRVLRQLEIWGTLAWSWAALRFWPARTLHALLDAPATSGGEVDPALIEQFRRTTRPIARGRCLLFAVALSKIARRRGVEAVVRVGFDVSESIPRGHAWVESGAAVLGDSAEVVNRFHGFHVTAAGLAAYVSRRPNG